MIKNYFSLVFVFFFLGNIYSQTTAIPDANFEQALIDLGIDSDATINGTVLTSDISGVISLSVSSKGIYNLSGIEDFINLTYLDCSFNQLTKLNMKNGNNLLITYFNATNNLNLTCIEVDNANDANAGLGSYADWLKDNTAIYSDDCFPKTYVPDNGFEQLLINEGYDDILDDYVLTSNISTVKELYIPSTVIPKSYGTAGDLFVNDLTGLEDFVSLEIFRSSAPIRQYDLSKNIKLKKLTIYTNGFYGTPTLMTLNITKNLALNYLSIENGSKLTRLDLTNNIALNYLSIGYIGRLLTSLDLTNNIALNYLFIENGRLLTSLDLTNNVALSYLYIDIKVTTLDLSYCTVLEEVMIIDYYQTLLKLNIKNRNNTLITNFSAVSESLRCIQVDNASDANAGIGVYSTWSKDATATYSEDCGYTTSIPDANFEQALIDLGIDTDGIINQSVLTSDISAITSLGVQDKNISDLTGIEAFTSLESLDCSYNQLTSLDLRQNLVLTTLHCNNNQLRNLDLSKNIALNEIMCLNNELLLLNVRNGNNSLITQFNVTYNPLLECIQIDNETDANAGTGSYSTWWKDDTATYSEDCSWKTYVPDDAFEIALIYWGYDDVMDDYLLTSNINTITSLYFPRGDLDLFGLGDHGWYLFDLTGIEDFIALETLIIKSNPLLSLDLSKNTSLMELSLNTIDNLTDLDLTNNISLSSLTINNSALTSLNLTNNSSLTYLNCYSNLLTSLDLSQNTVLEFLNCRYNQLTSLDISQNTALTSLACNNNQLTSLDVKNGNNSNITYFNALNNPDLTCIQVDNATYSLNNWVNKDATCSYFENCGYLGIDDEQLTQSINLYPNPVTNLLTIDSAIPLSKVEIYSVLGKKVKEVNSDFKSIQTSILSNGIYVVRMYSEDGMTTKKLIKK